MIFAISEAFNDVPALTDVEIISFKAASEFVAAYPTSVIIPAIDFSTVFVSDEIIYLKGY